MAVKHMFATITNLITKKNILGVFFCAVLFLTPLSLSIWGQSLSGDTVVSVKISSAQTTATTPVVQTVVSGPDPTAGPTKKESDAKFSAISFVGQLLGTLILAIPSALVWVAGQLFDTTLNTFVFGMGDFLNGSLNTAINNSWVLIRDICNLAFIFGFVYVGIRTIIDPESASTKRFLSKIIIGALLINFSLFFVKFIVDFANFTSYHLYSTMTNGGTGSLSATIADKLGITSFFSSPGSTETFSRITSGGVVWFYVLAAVLLFIVAFVLFAASILFITRFVGIVFIMIASPILFAATIFPQTEHYASDLWKKLISYAFFVPVFLLLLLISITLIGNLGIVKPGDGFSNALMNNGSPVTDGSQVGSMNVILNFIVIIFFFIQSLLIAQKMGVAGGDVAVSMGNKIRGKAQSALGRNTIGAASHSIREKYEKFDAKTKDSKNWNRVKTIGKIATLGAVDDRSIRGTLEAGEHAKFGGSYSYEDDKKYNDSRTARQAKTLETENVSKAISASDEADKVVTSAGGPASATDAQNAAASQARIKMERAVAGASTEQLQELLGTHTEGKTYNELVGNMSSSQFDNVMKLKSEDLDDSKKAKLSASRALFVKNKHGVVGGATGATPGNIGKADASDLDAMDFETVIQHAGHLTAKQIDDMKSLTPTAKKTLKDARKAALIAEFNGGAGASSLFNRITNDVERSKLPPEILTVYEAAPHLNTNVLSKIIENDTLTATERTAVKQNVLSANLLNQGKFNDFFNKSPLGARYG